MRSSFSLITKKNIYFCIKLTLNKTMKYLKYFEQASAYEAYKNGSDFITPNVSYAKDNNIVYYNPGSGSSSDYVMVDLGLPSGLKWADRNVGATSPEDAGLYFAWGENTGYAAEQVEAGEKTFNWSNCFDTTDGGSSFNKYATDKLTVLETADDAAMVNMGSDWRMPTDTECEELINNTTATFIDLDGNEFSQSDAQSGAIAEYNLKGIKLTSKFNSNSIFIPAAGYYDEAMVDGISMVGYLWSSSLNTSNSQEARLMFFYHVGGLEVYNTDRYLGLSIRGVCN